MVATGSKSCGPRSERGKAIAACNATKHGLLSTKPPLVAGEDLETFQGIVQGLIDEHQPQTPTEQLLVQQMAMAWLRLHRLWSVEAAIVNQQLLPPATYSEREHDNREELLELALGRKTEFHPDNLVLERQILQGVLSEITVESLPKRKLKGFKTDWEDWKRTAQRLLGKAWKEYPCKEPPASVLYSKEMYLEHVGSVMRSKHRRALPGTTSGK